MTTSTSDLTVIDRLASDVPGVREAAAVVDLRLKADGATGSETATRNVSGRPIPGDVLATVQGPRPSVPEGAARTISEALQLAARHAPDHGTTYVRQDGSTDRQTYAELLDEALRLLGGLRNEGVRPGDAVLVHHADNRSFVTTWWACVLGGFLPTPVATARDYSGADAAVRKLHAALELLEYPLVVTDEGLRDRVAGVVRGWNEDGEPRVASPASMIVTDPAEPYAAQPDDAALNLLTSGSTGTPKCVHHTNRSIIARTYATIQANGFTSDEVSLNWMPLDHVGGMVMFNLRDVVLRCEHVNAPTELVIRRPMAWLDLTERFRVTNTWAPNFAFSLVNKHATEIENGHWDLSSLRNICNAGEAVVPRTALRFLELLTPHGLPPDAMVPCWGMSETSSGVTYSRMDVRDPAVGTIALDPATLEDALVELPAGTPGAMTVSEVGAPIAGVSLRIVDDQGNTLPEGRVGRLHVSGSTIMRGYLRNAAANAAGFTDDGWFDTGDLGFLRDGRLFLTGRKKHMVIVNGVNYPAHEVEAVIEQVPGVRPACAAVCAIRDEGDDTDGIVAFFVPSDEATGELDQLLSDIRAALAADLALRPRWLVPVSEREFPRAPGGKVQREPLIERLAEGYFHERMFPGGAVSATSDREPGALLERVWLPVTLSAPPQATRTLLYAPAEWEDSPSGTSIISHAPAFRVRGDHHVEADLTDAEQQNRALAHLLATAGAPDRVVYAVEAGAEWEDGDDSGPSARFMITVAALARAIPDSDVTVLTSGSLGALRQDQVLPARATLPALVRTAAAEGLFRSIRLVDAPDAATFAGRPHTIPSYDGDIVAVREDGVGYAPRLRRLERLERFDLPGRFLRQGGTVLVTGGLGGVGRTVAEHLLVGSGARLLIVGRTPEPELSGGALEELRALGDVRYVAMDVADADALASAVADAEQVWGSGLDLVVHLAGTSVASQWELLSAHDLCHETLPWLRTMLRPKLGGGESIDRVLNTRPDTSVVLFSSVNGFLGGSGFGAYSAANAALDAFAHRWTARGHAVRCIAWSMWDGPGMNAGSPLVPAAQHRGLLLIDPGEGLSLLLEALHHPAPWVLAGVDAGNPHLKPHLAADEFEGGGLVVAVVPDADAEPGQVRHDVGAALAASGVFARVVVLRKLPLDESGAVDPVAVLAAGASRLTEYRPPTGPTEELVAQVAGELLGLEQVGRDDSFFGLGCDSIRAVHLAEQVGARLGREIPVSRLYEYPTVRELAAAVAEATVNA